MTDEKLASIIIDYVDEHYPDKPLVSMGHVMAWLEKNGHIEEGSCK